MIDEALAELIPALPKDRHELLSADFELVLEGQAYKKATVILLTDCLILRIEVVSAWFRSPRRTSY